MARVTIALKDLKPNPFKKDILGGKLDEEKILQLVESIEQTGFWENVICRKVDGRYELGYGHKRIEAAKRKLGAGFKIDIPVLQWTDEQMIQGMAKENATGEEESVEAQVDVICLTQKHLVKKYANGKGQLFDSKKKVWVDCTTVTQSKERHVEPSSMYRVAAFLGEKNWSSQKVADLINLKENLHTSVLKSLRTDRRSDHKTSLGQQVGVELAKLDDKNTQRAVAKIATESKGHVTVYDVRRIVQASTSAKKGEEHSTAIKEAIKVSDEARERTKARKVKKKKEKESQDIVAVIASYLPHMRKLKDFYEEVTTAIERLGENFLIKPPYSTKIVVGEFRDLGSVICRNHARIFESKIARR